MTLKSGESEKCGTEKDMNLANDIIRHPRTLLLHCAGVMTCMKTGCLHSPTKVVAIIRLTKCYHCKCDLPALTTRMNIPRTNITLSIHFTYPQYPES